MSTVTLVATDLDGTLLNEKKEVSSVNRDAILKLKDKGILFGIASGRPVETVKSELKKWNIESDVSFILGMNGGAFYDLRQHIKEDFYVLEGSVLLDIIHFFQDLKVDFWILEGSTRYTSSSRPETRAHADLFGETEIEIDLEKYLENHTANKLIIHFDPDYMPIVLERAKSYKNEACTGFLSANNLLEYVDPRINKGFGLEKVAKHFGVKLEDCVAFGDAQNDREMLQKVGLGVCMKNGADDVKSVSDYVTDRTNEESAFGYFLLENVL